MPREECCGEMMEGETFPWWSESQIRLQEELREFVDERIERAEKLIWQRKYPLEFLKEAGRRGWLGAIIPEEYGGKLSEYGYTGSCIIIEQLARLGQISMQYVVTMCDARLIMKFGSDELKREFLPKMAKGEYLGSLTVTEPFVGNDAAAIETVGRIEGDEIVIDGKKRFITSLGVSDFYMLLVRTSDDPDLIKKHRHLSMVIVRAGTPGFTIERINELIGFDNIYNGYLDFNGVRVPRSQMLGDVGDGWKVLMGMANYERTLASANQLGWMAEALRYAVFHTKRRVQFGSPTIDLPTNQFKLSEMIVRYKAARLLTYHAAHLFDLGEDPAFDAAIAKYFNTEEGINVFLEAIQLMGGDGLTRFYPVESYLRNGKITQLAPTTSEIMKVVIYRFGLKALEPILEAPRRRIDDELGVPVTVGFYRGKEPGDREISEKEVLDLLAENYRVNPGIHMAIEDMIEESGASLESLSRALEALEDKGLVITYRGRKGNIKLARATFKGIREAKPIEEYRYIPDWVDEKDLF
ncbi:MAG: acyl-CoA dehydrogenase [Candidatus Syntrophoarchaeum butanivorans]|uniref:Acyl-CoA dehydrogenase n=3 Tax=Candidatus Syntropharchaeum butanivorans TaxID=1839936 RepID=A0A1F2P435_9EURY|nr:MAG: acyl-CoA dehydrogenase [Candidatus Syntrophoarchaeum butanivorans]